MRGSVPPSAACPHQVDRSLLGDPSSADQQGARKRSFASVADGHGSLRASHWHKRKGRGLGPGTPSPAAIYREQVAGEVRAVIEDSVYRALIRLP
jgi:hypothetical protein